MADQYDPMKDPEKHVAPTKSVADKIIELALSAGGGAVTLLSGLLAAVLILYSGYVIFDSFATERAASSNAWDLLQFKPEILEDSEKPLTPAEMAEHIRDYRAWLTVYETNIDYPVVQGPNDTYYAATDIYGQPSLTGAVYLAAGNSADFSDSYNVIYGHHMDNGAMFGDLDKMNGTETGVIITEEEIYDVEFFAVVSTDAYEHRIYSVGNRMNDVLAFLRSGGEGGVGIGTHVTYFNEEAAADADKLVALSTCANANTNGRLVLIGKMTKRIVMKDVTVTKIWADNNNQDGIRPDTVTVVASDGTEIELKAEENWTATVPMRKFDNLGEIRYSWEERNVPGYTPEYLTEGDVTTITNTHVPEVRDVSVRKAWDDEENRDGIRPEQVTVTLSNGMEAVLDAAHEWTATIEGLPVYENGRKIAYSWTESEADGYTLTGNATGNGMTTLINTHVPEKTTVSIVKAWNDGDNQDGIRPAQVTVTLYCNDEPIGTLTLDEAKEWRGSFDGLYVNEGGKPIDYRWEEEAVDGYTPGTETEGTVTTLTNTHVPETTSLTVTKIWDDNRNQDGIRPKNLTVRLSDGKTVTLNERNKWTATLDNLPVYAAGEKIAYRWTEDRINGYTLTAEVTNGNTTTLTNRHETDTTVATVIKVWDDDGNRDGLRPESITMTLSDGQEVVLDEAKGWTDTVTGLPVNVDGKPIIYTWTEEDTEGYTGKQETDGTTTTFTNRHEIATTDLTVRKTWEDGNNQDGLRPESITVTLNAGDTPVQTVTLTAAKDWTETIPGLPVMENGEIIRYSWSEPEIAGYTPTEQTEGTVTTLTNTHVPEMADLTVVKTWDDGANQDGIRPDKVKVTLSDGETVTLSAEEGWTATLAGKPKYADGKPIQYAWTEEKVSGYELTGNVTDGTTTTLTNRHVPEETSLTVTKVWDDDNDRDGLRPSILEVKLLRDGKEIRTVRLNSANRWSAAVPGLPVYANGKTIQYSWEEDRPEGYELNRVTDGTSTTLTNSHTPGTRTLTVRKVWEDGGNQDGIRPEKLAVTLYAGELEHSTVELDEAGGWSANVTVPVNDRGLPVDYRWKEASVTGYTGEETTTGDTTVFTNTHVPAVTSRSIRKEWEDADNQDGVRPDNLTVYLLADGEMVRTVTLDEESEWAYTAENLPVYSMGSAIAYTWKEEKLKDYPRSSESRSSSETILTNWHEPEMTELTITKVWNDAENQDGLRPGKLNVNLLANGVKVDSVALDGSGSWWGKIENLPVYAEGKKIVYSWEEDSIEGYVPQTVTNGTATILTNTHETERTVATVTKVWDDDNDRDGKRPESIVMTLSNGAEVTLSEENHWTATVENLPRYRNGEEISYTWTEAETEDYVRTGIVTEGTVTTVTNRHDLATTKLTVVKKWDDDHNRDGIRPEQLTVFLNGTLSYILDEKNGWTVTTEPLPVYADGGKMLIYSWTEDRPAGYELTKETDAISGITVLTNRHQPDTTSRTVAKVWDDDGNAAGKRPDAVTVTLLADGEELQTLKLNRANRWTATADNLPVNRDGKAITYTWKEKKAAGYKLTRTRDEATENGVKTTLTNTYAPEGSTLTVIYEYLDGSEAAETVTEILAEGEPYDVVSPVIPGYTATIPEVTGTMPAEDVEVLVLYLPGEWTPVEPGAPLGFSVNSYSGDCLE